MREHPSLCLFYVHNTLLQAYPFAICHSHPQNYTHCAPAINNWNTKTRRHEGCTDLFFVSLYCFLLVIETRRHEDTKAARIYSLCLCVLVLFLIGNWNTKTRRHEGCTDLFFVSLCLCVFVSLCCFLLVIETRRHEGTKDAPVLFGRVSKAPYFHLIFLREQP
jgi:hypothetical protein